GIDFRINGEFVPGTESWASLSILQTQEDIKGDYFYDRYNAEGEKIIPGFTFDQTAVDSVRNEPGFIPRPSDQRVTFGVFFQDYLPKFPAYKVNLNFLFGTGLPFGPPGKDRYKDVLRIPPYRRVDIGFSKQIIGENVKRPPNIKLLKKFTEIWVNLEVYNLLQVNNTVSYIWVRDVTNRQYAVPNYLTSRQLNVRLSFRF
ncbi:MAG: TonB-dependent receptor, partial [Bacteroidia bacterium]|nr:TonB-dependent receptor [Bacteroidia bacterium]